MKEEQAHIDYIDDRIDELLQELYDLLEEKHGILGRCNTDSDNRGQHNS